MDTNEIMTTGNEINHNSLIGKSDCINEIKKRIFEYAKLDIPILITGESGTGKEVVANEIIKYSKRSDKPYLTINCGGLPPSLIGSELFGHIQGAFTGAAKTKCGFFEAANNGTLFLDEIGELPLNIQSNFLRVLDKGEYIRIGETHTRKSNVRIISATNKCLEKMVKNETFRNDLYFRLKGVTLHLLPLKDRKEDIPLLVKHFAGIDCHIENDSIEILKQYNWPGNVRELKMIIKAAKGGKNIITKQDVKKLLFVNKIETRTINISDYHISKAKILENFDKAYLSQLMHITNGNISKASTISNITRKHLRDLLKKTNIYNSICHIR